MNSNQVIKLSAVIVIYIGWGVLTQCIKSYRSIKKCSVSFILYSDLEFLQTRIVPASTCVLECNESKRE